jgi:hypothetical protein
LLLASIPCLMLVTVVMIFSAPPCHFALVWSLSNFTVINWVTVVDAIVALLLTSVGVFNRLIRSLMVPSGFVSPILV